MKILLIYGVGLFTIIAAATDWSWFFEHPKSRFFVKALGRQGARVFYVALGFLIVVLGFLTNR
jgi:hypothetical protein